MGRRLVRSHLRREDDLVMDGSLSVLIVDDSAPLLLLLRLQLRQIGCLNVEEVASGLEALQRLRSGDFKLVISDLHMPGMSGLELLCAIRADERLRSIPFILVTSEIEESYRRRAEDANAAYLQKPFDSAALREVIEQVLGDS